MALASVLALLSALLPSAAGFEGVTEPISMAVIGTTVSGKVREIPIQEGGRVRKGQVILVLEREEEELNVAITKVVAENRSDSMVASQKKATFERDYKATKRLYDSSNSVSEEQLWEKELNYKTAEAELLKSVMTKKKEWLEHDMAKAQLEKRILRAPFDGVVVKHRKKVAESVQALEPLVDVVDVRRCRFISYVVAQEAQGFRLGQTVNLQLDGARQPRLRKGKITFVSPVVDKASMLRTIKVVFENADGSIEPGVTGRILP